jgi:hypothetical protein
MWLPSGGAGTNATETDRVTLRVQISKEGRPSGGFCPKWPRLERFFGSSFVQKICRQVCRRCTKILDVQVNNDKRFYGEWPLAKWYHFF